MHSRIQTGDETAQVVFSHLETVHSTNSHYLLHTCKFCQSIIHSKIQSMVQSTNPGLYCGLQVHFQEKHSSNSTLTNQNHHKWHYLNSDWSPLDLPVLFADKGLANHGTALSWPGLENHVYMANLGCPYLIYRVCRFNLLVAGLGSGWPYTMFTY